MRTSRLLRGAAALLLAAAAVFSASMTAGAVNTSSQYMRGDADGNGRITVDDVTTIQKYCARLLTLSEDDLRAAEVNGDKTININDATDIQRRLAKYENIYLIGAIFCPGQPDPIVSDYEPDENELPIIKN